MDLRDCRRRWRLAGVPRLMALAAWFWAVAMLGRAVGAGSPAPTSVVFADLVHTPLGTASLAPRGSDLLVTNVGSSGADGVSIDLQELSRTLSIRVDPFGLAGPAGRRLTVAARGMVADDPDRALCSLNLHGVVGGMTLNLSEARPGWLNRLRAEVYQGLTKVGQIDLSVSDTLALAGTNARLAGFIVGSAGSSGATLTLFELEWSGTFSAGAGLAGNRLRLVAINPAGSIQNLSRVEWTGSGVGGWTFAAESAPRFEPELRVESAGSTIRLNWDTRRAVLLQAQRPVGPWNTLASDTNRFEVPSTGSGRFFQVRTDPIEPCSLRFTTPINYTCKRNVLLVIIDDVGIDQFPQYTRYYNTNAVAHDDVLVLAPQVNPAVATPTFDRLATAGVTFLNAWSSPTCSPSRAGLFTGNASFRHGVYSPAAPKLATNATTVAQVLGASGYTNGLFGKWHLGGDLSHLPNAFGWARFEGASGGDLPNYYDWIKDLAVNDSTGRFWVQSTVTNYATYENVENALAWLGTQAGPWMTTVSFNAPHWAGDNGTTYYQAPPARCAYSSRPNTNKGKYRSALECVDAKLADLLAGIETNVLAQTTIILMGDNGTEDEISDHFPNGRNKGSLYEGGVNVPLIIADGYTYLYGTESPWTKGLGRVVAPGRFETNLVQTMDLFATAAAIGRGDASCGTDSVSLVPYLSSPAAAPQRTIAFAETFASGRWSVAVRNQTHKLIVKGYCGVAPTYELYDLSVDRWERTLIPEDGTSATATALLAELAAFVAVPTACPMTPEYAVPTICP